MSEDPSRSRGRWQISLATLFCAMAVCAFLAWLTAALGSIVIAGLTVAVTIGIACGIPIGLVRRNVLAATVGAVAGAIVAVIVYVSTTVVQSITYGEFERLRGYHFTTFFVNYRILIRLVGHALALGLPFASIGAVHNRGSWEVIVFPAITCGGAVFLGGLILFGADAWARGGFPQPPLPWPIALAISLGSAVIGAALVGLATGLLWLFVRVLWRYFVNGAEKAGAEKKEHYPST